MEATIRSLADLKGCEVVHDGQFDRYQVRLIESRHPVLQWVGEFYARAFLNELESVREIAWYESEIDGFKTYKYLFLRDSRRIGVAMYGSTYMETVDEVDDLFNLLVETTCSLSDRALYEQVDSDDERYTDYWIGRLLCA